MSLALTGFIALFFIAAIAGIDLWLYLTNRKTFSVLMRYIDKKWPLFAPIVAFIMGMLFGHFFF